MVSSIRDIDSALGDGIKRPTKSELENINLSRKSIVAAKYISAGDLLTEENLTCKRPGNGISPMKWNSLIGRVASKSYKPDDLIDFF